MAKKYLLGLDLGTNSVGWCLTDENSNIVKKGKKRLWGVRLFKSIEDGQDAKSRRLNRAARRRTSRRAQRIDWLQSLFKNEIDKVDGTFFLRLNQSALHPEDKYPTISDLKYLFNDANFNDSIYYNKYPTIYHLRKHLLESKTKEDIRLVYLACAHIIKYRGNFIHEGRNFDASDTKEIANLIVELNEQLAELDIPTIKFSSKLISSFLDICKKTKGITKAKEELFELFGVNDKYVKNVIVPLIAGSDVSVKKIFDSDEDIEIKSISSKSDTFDESVAILSEYYGDTPEFKIILITKKMADIFTISKILGNEQYISYAMVNKYDTHSNDLKQLKKYVKNNLAGKYYELFRAISVENNYPHYIGWTKSNNKKITLAHCKREDFYKYLKFLLGIDKVKKIEDINNQYLADVYERINDGTFLPRQNSTDNGVFPYQLNLEELEIILRNQSKYYPFLTERGEYGTNIEKIISLLTFKIPYYVGPLISNDGKNSRGTFSWIVRNKDISIRPWNFSDVVDEGKTAEAFIKRMLNRCSYLRSCYCLPAKSIIYQRYDVYNTINKYRINGALISLDEKEELINNVFLKNKSVNKKRILNYFKGKYGQDVKITTSNEKEVEEISCSLSSEMFFKELLKDKYSLELAESIIQDLTIFEDKNILETRLKKIHGINDQSIINKIKNVQGFSGWGKLSKELLYLETSILNIETGEFIKKTILQILKDTNQNFMEIIYDQKYQFEKKISDYNGELDIKNDDDVHNRIIDYIDKSYVSTGMKRPLIQAVAIIEDIKKIIGCPVDEYYIECARTNKNEKVRTLSRKEKIIALYNEAIKICKKHIAESNDLVGIKQYAEKEDTNRFRSERLWLYFLQMGKCAYTLNPISIEEIFDDSKYDVDHIIPQSKIKDDSISNKVLVEKWTNAEKSDTYPIYGSSFINPNARGFWKFLLDVKLMDEKKYSNLTRREPITDDELQIFVNRQLVFTNQSIKALAEVIKLFEKRNDGQEPVVVYSKAENITEFRHQFEIIKSRDANNLHHAHDAYLNVCIGRLLATYYNYGINKNFIKEIREKGLSIVPNRIWSDNKEKNRKPILDSSGNLVWDYRNSVQKIKKNIFETFDVLVTTRQYIAGGILSKVTIKKASDDKDGNLIPLKNNNSLLGNAYKKTNKYGGYSGLVFGFFSLVKYKKKNNYIISLEKIPNMFVKDYAKESIISYLKDYCGISSAEVLIPVVRINSILKKGKTEIILTGTTGDTFLIANNHEPYFCQKTIRIIKKISTFIEKAKKEKIPVDAKNIDKLLIAFPTKLNEAVVVSPASSKRSKENVISNEELYYLYNELKTKLSSNIFENIALVHSLADFLDNDITKKKFDSLNIYLKIKCVYELFNALYAKTTDTTLIDGTANSCKCRLNKNAVVDYDFIVESPTGFFRKVIWNGDKQ